MMGLLFLCGLSGVWAQEVSEDSENEPVNIAEATTPEEPPRNNVSLVVAGAVTMGDYQAGQMWVMTQLLKRAKKAAPESVDVVTVVGSSAGSINALVASVDLLTEGPNPVPEDSLFFKTWVPMGLSTYIDSVDYHPSDYEPYCQGSCDDQSDLLWGDSYEWTPNAKQEARERSREGLISHAHFDLLLTTLGELGPSSANKPEFSEVRVGMTADRLLSTRDEHGLTREESEAFGFQVLRDGEALKQHRLRLSCDTTPDQPERTFDEEQDWHMQCRAADFDKLMVGQQDIPFGDMGWHIKPSSGIPAAFPLWDMPCEVYSKASLYPVYSTPHGGTMVPACQPNSRNPQDPLTFIDGGVFNGNPVNLADAISWTIDEPGQEPWKAEGTSGSLPFDLIFFDPDASDSGYSNSIIAEDGSPRLPNRLGRLAGSIITTARLQAITNFRHQEGPRYHAESTLVLDVKNAPISEYIAAFYGLFDRSIRAWDFYAGMHDTLQTLDDRFDAIEAKLKALPETHPTRERDLKELETLRNLVPKPKSAAYDAVHTILSSTPANDYELAKLVSEAFTTPDKSAFNAAAHSALIDQYPGWYVQSACDLDVVPDTEDVKKAQSECLEGYQPEKYEPEVMRSNLEALSYVMGLRHLNATMETPRNEEFGVEWFGDQLSAPAVGVEDYLFSFYPWDLTGGWLAKNRQSPNNFNNLVQQRLTWLASQMTRREFLGGATPALNLAQSALMGNRTQLSYYLGTPLVPESVVTFGAGMDYYSSLTRRRVGFGGRYLIGAPPNLFEQLLDPENADIGTLHTIDLRLNFALPASNDQLGALHGNLSFELSPFVRTGWMGSTKHGVSLDDVPGFGLDPEPFKETRFCNPYSDTYSGEKSNDEEVRWSCLTPGLEARLRVMDTVSFSVYGLNPIKMVDDVRASLNDSELETELDIFALMSVSLPTAPFYRAPKTAWPLPETTPSSGGRHHLSLRPLDLALGSARLSYTWDLSSDRWALGLDGEIFHSDYRWLLAFDEDHFTRAYGISPSLRHYLPRREVIEGELPGTWRAWYIVAGVGYARVAADSPLRNETPSGEFAVAANGVIWRSNIGREWRLQGSNPGSLEFPLRIGLGLRGIQTSSDDLLDQLKLSYDIWEIRPDSEISIGVTWPRQLTAEPL